VADVPLPAGKLPAALLRALLPTERDWPDELVLPPRVGEDACVIDLRGGALVVASDPITLTGRGVGRHAVVINANDVAVTGARPRWFLSTLLFPLGTREEDVRAVFEEMHDELTRLGASLVGGHTEITAAVSQPVVVGQMMGLREDGHYVRTGGMRPGNVIVQVGAAPVEGAVVLASEGGAGSRSGVTPALLEAARGALEDPGISVVSAALRCAELGATAMHDPTEGGLSAGLHELAETSGLAICEVSTEAVLWFEPGLALCRALDLDPWGTLASGALLAAFEADAAEVSLAQLAAEGFLARAIGEARRGEGVSLRGGAPLPRYERDELSRL
jgi:hydrogenase maturation factor